MAKALQSNDINNTDYTSTQQQEVAKLLTFTKKPGGYRKEYLTWKHILRANSTTKANPTFKNQHLGRAAQNLLAPIVQKLIKGERVVLNHKYISSITGTGTRQNKNIIKECSGVLDAEYHRSVVVNGKKRTRSYEFSFKAGTLEESKVTESNLENPTGKFISHHYTKENNNIENIRYITHARESISCNNSNINHPANNLESADTKKIVSKENVIVATDTQATPSVVSLQNKHRAPNKRKKPLKSAKIIRPTFYSKPKRFEDMQPFLDQNTCAELRFSSGRDFSNNFISQKVLALSKKPELTVSFKTKQGFISYMTTVLKREMHDPVKTAGNNFRLRVNLTSEDMQYRTQEKLLNEVEQQAITHVCPENQLKAKIAGRLEGGKAYQLLSNFKCFDVEGDVLKIHLTKPLELTENDKDIILSQAKAVYSTASGISVECVERVEFVVSANNNIIQQIDLNPTHQGLKHESPPLELPKGIWGEISQKLIDELGADTYRNWLSKLTAEVDEEAKTIVLTSSSEFVQDWVRNNYETTLQSITSEFGLRLQGV
jgi:hypothetical protein